MSPIDKTLQRAVEAGEFPGVYGDKLSAIVLVQSLPKQGLKPTVDPSTFSPTSRTDPVRNPVIIK